MLRIALVNAPLQSAVCDHGVGHQMPLGLLMVGGPLRDVGYPVTLIDAAVEHLGDWDIVRRTARFGADVVMICHVGSTQAHPCCLRVLRAVKAALPHVVTVYGGVFPTYHKEILAHHPEVDVIVRGEGEATALDLVQALDKARLRGIDDVDLSDVPGIVWRRDGEVVMNSSRPPIEDLERYRIGWELIEDWDRYQAFGLGRAAVVQFSRGCPHTCTYCGQWMFWKRWRHRNVTAFVDEMEWLYRKKGVRFFWIADENPTTLKEVWRSVLEEIIRREMDIGLCASIRAQDIVRDADILPLYRRAGFTYVLMGIETVTDATLDRIRKGSSVDDGYQAVRLLRQNHILSIIDYIFGLDEETPQTIVCGLRGLLRYDGDFVNALYVTPHSWTPLGGVLTGSPIVEEDQWKWDYRHQVVGVKSLTPGQLFLGVKLVEFLYHLHPRRLWRVLTAPDRRMRQQLRHAYWHITRVFWYEVYEFLRDRLWRRKPCCEGAQKEDKARLVTAEDHR
jgi:anaerobic magnesium-protoporphyrin IX monomethyl ester cyclase